MTKAEHKAKHPSAWEIVKWNRENEEKYTPEEINESKKIL